jgi:hypothetical protein
MNLRAVLIAVSALSTIGCGGPPASIEGTIQGKTFAPLEAVSDLVTVPFGQMAIITASTEQGSCTLFSQNKLRKNAQFLLISLANVDITQKTLHALVPTGPNDFPILAPTATVVTTPTISFVSVQMSDANCMDQPTPVDAVDGTVTLTSADDLEYEGSGDVVLTTGDHITFTFNSTACFSLGSALTTDKAPTCL